jgi:hypothetical protein
VTVLFWVTVIVVSVNEYEVVVEVELATETVLELVVVVGLIELVVV